MNLFGRLFEPRLPRTAQWTIATSEDHGRPLIVRYRSTPPEGVEQAEYAHLMVVQWRYEPANEGGLPSSAATEHMNSLEQLLEPALEGPRAAFNTVVVTGGGVREWQWYTRDPEEFMRLVNAGLSGHPPFPVSFNVQGQDPTWSAYSGFSASAT